MYLLKKYSFQEELCQLIVALPDCTRLGQKPDSKEGLEDMRLLLLLLLGCAVQCPNKHTFIEKIKALPVECQHTLVHCIQQVRCYLILRNFNCDYSLIYRILKVTETQEIVLSPGNSENAELLTPNLLLKHIKRLLKERDYYFQVNFIREECTFILIRTIVIMIILFIFNSYGYRRLKRNVRA